MRSRLKSLTLACFTLMLMSLATLCCAATFTTSPTIVASNTVSPGTVITLTGSATAWNSGTTVFSVSGLSGVSIISQSVTGTTAATITVTTSQPVGTFTISDNADAATNTIATYNWQTLKSDSFSRPDTSAASAGTQTGTGNNWIDTNGGIWRIKSGQLRAASGSAVMGQMDARPVSEAVGDSRIVLTRNMNSAVQVWGVDLRKQSDTSRYYVNNSGTTFRINRVSAANSATTLLNTLITAPSAGDLCSIDVICVNSQGNVAIVAIWNDYTQGNTVTATIVDNSGSKITSTGVAAVDVGDTTTQDFSSAQIYYSNPSYCTPDVAGIGSSTSNTTINVTGFGTLWTSGTTWSLTASGSNGAALGTTTFIDSTHFTIVLSSSGTVNDSLVITEATSGTKFVVAVTAPEIYVNPSNILDSSTGNLLTVTGSTQLWLSSAPVFTVSGVSGVSITSTTATSNTTATITVTTGSSTGTVTLNDTNVSFPTSTTFNVIHAIKLNDSNIITSPYNITRNGSLYQESNYAGSYWKVSFTTTGTGPVNILYDPTPNIQAGLAASNYPTIGWTVNSTASGGNWTYVQLSAAGSTIPISTSLSPGTYELDWYVKSIRGGTETGGRWNPSARKPRFIGLQADSSAVTNALTLRSHYAIFFGDSITQGAGVLGATSASNDDANAGWVKACADAMDAEYGNCGMAAQLISGTLTSIPGFYISTNTPPDTYSWQESGITRLDVGGKFTPVPDYVFINEGTNDVNSTVTNNVSGFLTDIRSKCGTNTYIFVILPFGGQERSLSTGIPSGYNNYIAAHPSDKRTFMIDCGFNIAPLGALDNNPAGISNAYSFDHLHPKSQISMSFGAKVAQTAQSDISSLTTTGTSNRGIHAGGHFTFKTQHDMIFTTIKTLRRTY